MAYHYSEALETETPHAAPHEHAAAIDSRFLFVDVAAQRAKQLRRGARPRLAVSDAEHTEGWRPDAPHKLERVAMEEVKRRLVLYTLPPQPSTRAITGG
jgi:DNA-directed RNA polymerase subunit K/omega